MVLFISNGHGEDLAGAMIAVGVRARPRGRQVGVAAFPLVGKGKPYAAAGVDIVTPTFDMPSGGFAKHGAGLFARDVAAGLAGAVLRQARAMTSVSRRVSAAVVVGDTYALLWSRRVPRRRVLFLSTAKSSHIHGHTAIDAAVMKRRAAVVLTRDERTALDLRGRGVRAEFAGNILMDAFDVTGENFGLALDGKVVGILPGSRPEAYDNMTTVAPALELVAARFAEAGERVDFLVALAPSLDAGKLARALGPAGWTFEATGAGGSSRHVVGRLVLAGGAAGTRRAGRVEVVVATGAFGDVLNVCDVFIGLAGTANEQAAGMGKPVVGFPGRGPQFNRRFSAAQGRLLGEALRIVEPVPESVASAVVQILRDGEVYRRMRSEGEARMGGPGACERIVAMIDRFLESGEWAIGGGSV